MHKHLFIALGLVAILIGSSSLLLGRNDKEAHDNRSESLLDNIRVQSESNPFEVDQASFQGPYEVTLLTRNDPNGDIRAIANVDARGNVRTTIQEASVENMFLYIDDQTYIRMPQDQSWLKVGGADNGLGADDIFIGYTDTDLRDLTNVTEVGEDNCTLGRCRTYTSVNTITNEQVELQVELASKRVSDIHLTAPNGKRTEITYDYSAAFDTITPPQNFKEFYTSGT